MRTSNTLNRKYAGCLPIFKAQARECAAFFRDERGKCDAGGSGMQSGGAAPDQWSDGGSTGGGSVWDPPAADASDSGYKAVPVRAGGEAERKEWEEAQRILDEDAEHRRRAGEDAPSCRAALSEVLGEAPQTESAQDDYAGALVALERREAEARREAEETRREAEREVKREAALRAEKQELREMQEREAERRRRAEREAEYQAAREARRANDEALRQLGNTLMQRSYGYGSDGTGKADDSPCGAFDVYRRGDLSCLIRACERDPNCNITQ